MVPLLRTAFTWVASLVGSLALASSTWAASVAASASSAESSTASALGSEASRVASARPLVIGSKRFTESYVLGEIVRQVLVRNGHAAEHRQGLGNTGILESALAAGSIDAYPEYTGTIVRELLKRDGSPDAAELDRWLAPLGLKVGVRLGFNNSYALAMLESTAARLGVVNVSDLAKPAAQGLRFGLSHEFLERGDGWPALGTAYGLKPRELRGLDHGLAYGAITASQLDVIDVYATDAKVGRLGLRMLVDDRGFFPRYDAVLLMRAGVDARWLQALEGRIDNATMTRLNGEVELDGGSFEAVAARFVASLPIGSTASSSLAVGATTTSTAPSTSGPVATMSTSTSPTRNAASGRLTSTRQTFWQRLFAPDFGRLALQHVTLVLGSLALAIGAGVPLGIAAWRWPPCAGPVLGAVAILQTVPSLALLAFLIAWVGGIGIVPAVIALFLYALLPIVRNTHAGLQGVAPGLAQAALSLGLTPTPDPRAGAAAARGTDAARRHQDRSGHQCRHRDHGRLHRRRRVR